MAKLLAITPSIFLYIFGTLLFLLINARHSDTVHDPGSPLMIGKGLGFFDTSAEAEAELPKDVGVDRVKGRKVAEGKRAPVMDDGPPKPPLERGTLIKKFNSKPQKEKVDALTSGAPVENAKGKMLSEDVRSGSYVQNPARVLGEILAEGKPMPEVVEGEIIAGDPAELDVITSLEDDGGPTGGDDPENPIKQVPSNPQHSALAPTEGPKDQGPEDYYYY